MKNCFLHLFLFHVAFVCAQERLGIANSNYYTVSSIHLNPSSSSDARVYMQFNLIGVNVFAKTNIGYLSNFNYINLYRTRSVPALDINKAEQKKFFYANAVVDGPTFIISNGNYGGGVFVRGRSVVDMRRVPYELAEIAFGLKDPGDMATAKQNIKNAKASNMSWLEYGVNLSAIGVKRRNTLITGGVNLKYLTGINIMYANLKHLETNYTATSLVLDTIDGIVKYNKPAFNAGKGFGFDAGITYKKMLGQVDSYLANSTRSGCNYIDYKYKVGISLRDIGYIKFGRNTTVTELHGSGYVYAEARDSSFQSVLATRFNTSTVENKRITAFTPASLSAQLDYNFENNVFLNVTLIKNLIPSGFTGVQSPDLLSVCPRFEVKNFEAALPLTFNKFRYPQLGFAFRIRTFVFGFDNIVPLFMSRNTNGLGVYFNLGLSLFRNQACRGKVKRVDDCAPKRKIKGKKQKSRNGYNMKKISRRKR
jgi:hypothetical protein